MVNIEPYDNIKDVDCRWKIEGWRLVSGKDLEKELKTFNLESEELEEEEEEDD